VEEGRNTRRVLLFGYVRRPALRFSRTLTSSITASDPSYIELPQHPPSAECRFLFWRKYTVSPWWCAQTGNPRLARKQGNRRQGDSGDSQGAAPLCTGAPARVAADRTARSRCVSAHLWRAHAVVLRFAVSCAVGGSFACHSGPRACSVAPPPGRSSWFLRIR
jgi:hypothetical protein